MPTAMKRQARKIPTPAKPSKPARAPKATAKPAAAAPRAAPEEKRGPGRPPLEGGEGRPYSIYMDPGTRGRVLNWASVLGTGISEAFRRMAVAAGDPPAAS
jgi:hypothetical protein